MFKMVEGCPKPRLKLQFFGKFSDFFVLFAFFASKVNKKDGKEVPGNDGMKTMFYLISSAGINQFFQIFVHCLATGWVMSSPDDGKGSKEFRCGISLGGSVVSSRGRVQRRRRLIYDMQRGSASGSAGTSEVLNFA